MGWGTEEIRGANIVPAVSTLALEQNVATESQLMAGPGSPSPAVVRADDTEIAYHPPPPPLVWCQLITGTGQVPEVTTVIMLATGHPEHRPHIP